jgi:hypothetical protein
MKGPTLTDRIRLARGAATLAALVVIAAAAQAQDTTATRAGATTGAVDAGGFRTHTVRAGESLWDIAHTYLGDGDLWPEITRLNRGLVQDPHWIFPNEVLRIPPRPAGAPSDSGSALAAAPAPTAESAPASPPAAAAAATTAPAEPSPDAAAPAAADEASPSATGSTLFNHPPQGAALFAAARGGSLVNRKRDGVNPGEHNSAPYMDRDGGPLHAGRVVGVTDVSNVIVSAEVEHYSLHQDIYITMPLGSHPEVGERFYTYSLGESFGDRGQIVEPTGIVTVIQAGSGNVASTARITQVFGEIRLGEGVLPLDQAILPSGAAAPFANSGPQTHVVWVEHDQVLPTLGFYVVLDASGKAGVRLGDQFTLFRPREALPASNVVLPESEVAIAQVVRVTPFGSTAIVISQVQPAISPGIGARVTARINAGQ